MTKPREYFVTLEYRTRLTADVVTGKLDVRPAAARLRDVAADDAEMGTDILDDGAEVEQASAED